MSPNFLVAWRSQEGARPMALRTVLADGVPICRGAGLGMAERGNRARAEYGDSSHICKVSCQDCDAYSVRVRTISTIWSHSDRYDVGERNSTLLVCDAVTALFVGRVGAMFPPLTGRIMRIFAFAVLMLGAVPKTSRPSGVQDDRAGVEAFNKAFDAATRRMDTPATLALWDDDGVSLMPSARPVVGKPAIAAFMAGVVKDLTGAHMQSFTNQCFDIAVSGDWASEWCVEHQVVRFASGKMFDGWGKLLLVLHRGGDGRWKLREEMWNQGTAADSAVRTR
jgi:ketosteroid isomerase-like protein